MRGLVAAFWEFYKVHRLLTFIMALLMLAASAAGLYLLYQQIPTLVSLPCLRGGCGG